MCGGTVRGDARRYSRADLERVARLAAERAMHGEPVTPAILTWLSGAVRDALERFDEERGSALGFSAEQLSGTRSESADARRRNRGHGHVHPRPDGAKARCGGPGICSECSREQAADVAARRAALERAEFRGDGDDQMER